MPKRKIKEDQSVAKSAKLDSFLIKSGDSVYSEKYWTVKDDVAVYNPTNLAASSKFYGFDLDYTLICPKSGKRFPKSWDDWMFLFPEVPEKLKSINKEGDCKIIIFTNQGGVEKGKTTVKDVKQKFESIINKLGFNVQVFASFKYGSIYRKPCTGMFDIAEKDYNNGIKFDREKSLYVGDAAGRAANWAPGKKKDFNNADILFAKNIGVPFKTPDEFFLGQKPVTSTPLQFDPYKIGQDAELQKIKVTSSDKKNQFQSLEEALPKGFNDKSIIILIGSPGSGKSTFSKKVLERLGFTIINRDSLKTASKCLLEARKNLEANKSIVIDNTNPDVKSRGDYIDLAKFCNAKHIIGIYLDISMIQCQHNENFRRLTKSQHDHISTLVFRMYNSKFKAPELSEGFTSIIHVVPELKFDNDEHKKLYFSYISDAGY